LTRITVRQLRELVERLVWRFELPAGFGHSATSIVVAAELRTGKALPRLLELVETGLTVDPAAVRLVGPAELDAGGQSLLYAGPIAADFGAAVTNAADIEFAAGLEGEAPAVEAIDVDDEVWERLYRYSLDVLLSVPRNPYGDPLT
jgi:hypothetical protein